MQQPIDFNPLDELSLYACDSGLPPYLPYASTSIYGSARYPGLGDLADVLGGHAGAEDGSLVWSGCFPMLADDKKKVFTVEVQRHGIALDSETRARNILIVGQTGSGKNQKLLNPAMLSSIVDTDPHASHVVMDVKGDLYALIEEAIADMPEEERPRLLALNLTNPARSVGINLLSCADDNEMTSDIAAACYGLQPRARGDSPFFRENACRFITAMAFVLRSLRGSVSYPMLTEAFDLPESELRKLLCLGIANCEMHTASVLGFLNDGGSNASTVMAEVSMLLRCFASPDVAAVTSSNEFTPTELLDRPTVLVIEAPSHALGKVAPALNLFLQKLLRMFAHAAESSPGGRLPRRVHLFLDEFCNFGTIPDYAASANTWRSRGVSCMACVQSLGQLGEVYGDAAESVLTSFNTIIFQPPVMQADSRYASNLAGTTTLVHPRIVERRTLLADETTIARHVERSEELVSRPLLLPEQINQSPPHPVLGRAALVALPGKTPFFAWFRPAYELPQWRKKVMRAKSQSRAIALRKVPLKYEPWYPIYTRDKESEERRNEAQKQQDSGTDRSTFTDVHGWSNDKIVHKLEDVKDTLDFVNCTDSARRWWEAFENENKSRLPLVLRLAEELANRNATITEFFLAHVYSNSDNIQANLFFLDYTRLKQKEGPRIQSPTVDDVETDVEADEASDWNDDGLADHDETDGSDWDGDEEQDDDDVVSDAGTYASSQERGDDEQDVFEIPF